MATDFVTIDESGEIHSPPRLTMRLNVTGVPATIELAEAACELLAEAGSRGMVMSYDLTMHRLRMAVEEFMKVSHD